MILLNMAVLLAASLVAGDAAGQTEAPSAPPSTSGKDATAGKDATGKPAPSKKPPVKRRAVQQIVDGMPAYGPRLNAPPVVPVVPVSPQTLPSSAPPAIAPVPGIAPPPAVIGHCDAGGCTDVNGTRYNGAAGSTVIGPQGRSCTNHGGVLQCF